MKNVCYLYNESTYSLLFGFVSKCFGLQAILIRISLYNLFAALKQPRRKMMTSSQEYKDIFLKMTSFLD